MAHSFSLPPTIRLHYPDGSQIINWFELLMSKTHSWCQKSGCRCLPWLLFKYYEEKDRTEASSLERWNMRWHLLRFLSSMFSWTSNFEDIKTWQLGTLEIVDDIFLKFMLSLDSEAGCIGSFQDEKHDFKSSALLCRKLMQSWVL